MPRRGHALGICDPLALLVMAHDHLARLLGATIHLGVCAPDIGDDLAISG
jgi:hypothetical protein